MPLVAAIMHVYSDKDGEGSYNDDDYNIDDDMVSPFVMLISNLRRACFTLAKMRELGFKPLTWRSI